MSTELRTGERQVLRRYLLGQLSPVEQDEVEDRFADPDYFAVYQKVERALVQEYAAGTMSPAEAELFARNYLVTKKRRDQVAIAQALSEVYYTPQTIQQTRPARFPKWIPVAAMAASVVLGAVVVRHLLPSRPVLTASVRPAKPPAIFTRTPSEAHAIGAAVGGGASVDAGGGALSGAAGRLFTGKSVAKIAPETRLTYKLTQPVTAPPPPASSPLAQPPPAPDSPVVIKMGMTIDELVAAIGQPKTIAGDPASEAVYTYDYYNNVQVTLVRGRVTDMY